MEKEFHFFRTLTPFFEAVLITEGVARCMFGNHPKKGSVCVCVAVLGKKAICDRSLLVHPTPNWLIVSQQFI